ncbi:MAG: nucleotide exchange factor GrpE [Anaerolineales bacterium]|jgi:molecular chaperone GrpE
MSSKKVRPAAEETPTEPPTPGSEQAARRSEPEGIQPSAPVAEAGPVVAAEELEALRQQLSEAQAQAAEYKDGWQRAVADFSNYRKRLDRENLEIYQNAAGEIIKRYLPILDDLERALASRPADLPWIEGIELICRKLQAILEAEGLKRIEAEGQLFDPNFHEAISQEPNADVESGRIIAVVQNGYMLGERVIRPALVRVAQ